MGRVLEGRYRLIEVLGKGGMGIVWRAADERICRDVVLKQLTLPHGLEDGARAQLMDRMKREAKAAGKLKHHSIITVHDQFSDEHGLPWIVMELVDGRSLDQVIKARGALPVPEAARIGARVAEALQAAHDAGIVHRDIKPANILLEGDRVVVTDFGLAAIAGEATLTQHGALIGTIAYMAPEQLNDREATAASDLWSLGATLHTAVEGRQAFTGRTTAALLLAVSRGTPMPAVNAGALKPVLDDLMRIDPDRRPTARQISATLASVANSDTPTPLPVPDLPVQQESPTVPSRPGGRLTRRRLISAVGTTGIAGAIPTAFYFAQGNAPTPDGRLTGHTSYVYSLAFSPDGITLATTSADASTRLWNTKTRQPIGAPLTGHTDYVYSVAFSPDGSTLATASADATARLWNAKTRQPIGEPLTGHTSSINSLAFSPDGTTLATASHDRTARLWNTSTRQPIGEPLTGHTSSINSLAFSPDGTTLATTGGDSTVRLWNTKSPALPPQRLNGHTSYVYSLAFSPDGSTLATAGHDRKVRLWDARNPGPPTHRINGHTSHVLSVAFSPDGATLATAGSDRTLRLWDAKTRQPIGEPLRGHTNSINSVAFSPDGNTLATASHDKTVRLWQF